MSNYIKIYANMKKFIKQYGIIISSLFLMIGFFSCQDLEENPAGMLGSETFYTTTADLDAAVMATYKALADDPWGGYASRNIWNPLMAGDDMGSANGGNAFDRFNATDLNTSMHWRRSYITIRQASDVINNAGKVVGGSEAYINKCVAEARFLRAWNYFWLVRLYGAIPMVISTEINYDLPKSSVAEIYALIVEDLTFAVANLPKSRAEAESDSKRGPGQPSIWSAKALLSQVYITMAGWPINDASKYALAAKEALDVINSNEYRLLDDFDDLWWDENDNNDEIVWSIQFCNFPDCGVWQRCTFIGLNVMAGEDAGGWTDFPAELGFYNRFPEGYRKERTFQTVFEQWRDGELTKVTPFEESAQKRPHYKKFRNGYVYGAPDFNGDSDHMGGRDLPYLRFAEVLLLYAEAQCMADGGPNTLAYQCINRVRERAQKGVADDLTPGLDKIAFRNAVIDERGWEFAQEFCRWFDLVRTEKVEETVARKVPEIDYLPLNPVTKERYIFPIPYTEKLLNPNL